MGTCWSCSQEPGKGAFCAGCGAIQPETPADHFTVLGLPARYSLDPGEVEKHYRDLQRKLHPDRFATRTPDERRMSLERATSANAAYRTLRDPVRRAEYLLELSGHRTPGEGHVNGVDPAFLAGIMELRETLDEARTARDHALVQKLATDVRGRLDTTMAEIAGAFAQARPEEVTPLLARLRYFARFLDEVTAIEESS